MTTSTSPTLLKRAACGFSGILVGAGILGGLIAVGAAVFGFIYLLSLVSEPIWQIVGVILHYAFLGISALALGWFIWQIPTLIANLRDTWRRQKQYMAEEEAREAERRQRLANLPPLPPVPKLTLAERWLRLKSKLTSVWEELKADMASLQLPPSRQILLVLGILGAELGLLYGLAVLNNLTFVPTEKSPEPEPLAYAVFGFFLIQYLIAMVTTLVWAKLDERAIPTHFQRVSAAAAAAFLPLYALVASPLLFAGTSAPAWAVALSGLPLGMALMVFVLGFVFTCEENIFEMMASKPKNTSSDL